MNEHRSISASRDAASADRPWTALMIRPLSDKGVGTRASFVRGTFQRSSRGGAETLRISALGLYRAFINGKRVGDDQLTPGWTSYQARLSYQTYDVSNLLVDGENVIDIWLGDGWLRSQMGWKANPVFNTWGSEIAAIAEIASADGEVILATDTTWRSGLLPVMKSGIYFGEIYDAREEDLAAGQGVAEVTGFDLAKLIPHEVTPVKELEPLKAIGSTTDGEGRTVYDFGQNSGGYVAMTVKGERGARVIVEHSEILDKDGNLQREPALGRGAASMSSRAAVRRATGRSSPSWAFAMPASRSRARPRSCRSSRPDHLGAGTDRRVHLGEHAGQPAGAQYALEPARQLHRSRPTVRSATTHGLTGDAQCSRRRLLSRRQPCLPRQVAARRDGRPARGRRHRACVAQPLQ